MSDGKIRRFTRFQIVFHWIVGVPYMLLLASGALIMLQRLGFTDFIAPQLVRNLHRWVGIGLTVALVQTLFAALMSGQLTTLLKDFIDWVLIRPRDLLWLAKVPLNILWPRRFPLPPAGRFNAGQKLHGLFILVALTTFSITGILIILRPAALRPWIIHSWLFFGALAFLSLHLFLGLINPVTRRALGGIFTGYVPKDYVQEHHALLLDPPEQPPHPHAVVSWKALLASWLMAIAVAGVMLWWYGPQHAITQALQVSRQDHAMISPGPLIAAHADDPRATRCDACHQSLNPPSDSACLACHDQIRQVMQQRLGWHGQVQGHCRTCHADHKGRTADIRNFDPRTFNHQQARFTLTGKHQTLDCDQCHVAHSNKPGQRQFIDLKFSSCSNCHETPHVEQQFESCTRCHTEQGWKGRQLLFEHNRDSAFKIDAIHSSLACASCHKVSEGKTLYRPLATACEQCHTPVAEALAGKLGGSTFAADPHNGRVRCTDCHAPGIQSPTPAQYAAACQQCHTPRYRGLYFDWQRSLADRSQAAQDAIKRIEATDPSEAKSLEQRRTQALLLGLHNLSLAIKILDSIPAAAAPPQGPSNR